MCQEPYVCVRACTHVPGAMRVCVCVCVSMCQGPRVAGVGARGIAWRGTARHSLQSKYSTLQSKYSTLQSKYSTLTPQVCTFGLITTETSPKLTYPLKIKVRNIM